MKTKSLYILPVPSTLSTIILLYGMVNIWYDIPNFLMTIIYNNKRIILLSNLYFSIFNIEYLVINYILQINNQVCLIITNKYLSITVGS